MESGAPAARINAKTCPATWRFGAGDSGIVCVVCVKPITENQHAMDFFWASGKPKWAHNDCVRGAMEKWITRKEENGKA